MSRLLFSLCVGALGVVSVFGSAACSTHTIIHTTPQPAVTFDKTCAKTACEAQTAATPSRTSHCSECIGLIEDTCIGGGSCDTSQCNFACNPPSSPSPPACTDTTTCAEYTWVAHLAGFTATPGVEQACIDANDALSKRCGIAVTDDQLAHTQADCALQARLLTDAAVSAYACLASIDCKTFDASCYTTSTLGDDFCATREASCGSPCDEGDRKKLNADGVGLKPALIAATQTCAGQSSCKEVDACMAAWWKIFDVE